MRKETLILLFSLLLLFTAIAIASSRPPTLAVMYFNNGGVSEEWDWLRKGLADMVITDLAESGKFEVVEREEIQKLWMEIKLVKAGLVDETAACEMGNIVKADMVLFGDFRKVADELTIEVRLMDMERGEIVRVERVEGKADDIFKLEKELVLNILKNLNVELTPEELTRIKRIPTDSIDAATHFYNGLDEFDYGVYGKALVEFKGAVKKDPDYVKARYWLGRIYYFQKEYEHALVEYNKIVELFPQENIVDLVYYQIGSILETELGGYQKAIENYKEVLGRHPEYEVDKDKVIEELIRQKKDEWSGTPSPDKRYKYCIESLKRMGLCYERLGDDMNAYRAYFKLIYMTPREYDEREEFFKMHKLYAKLMAEGREDLVEQPIGFVTLDPEVPEYYEDFSTDKRFKDVYQLGSYSVMHDPVYVFVAPKGYQIDWVDTEIQIKLLSFPNSYKLGVSSYDEFFSGFYSTSSKASDTEAHKAYTTFASKKERVVLPKGTRIICVYPKARDVEILSWKIEPQLSRFAIFGIEERVGGVETGSLQFTTEPSDAITYVDDNAGLRGSRAVHGLKVGKHAIKVVKDGCPTKTTTVNILPGRLIHIYISLLIKGEWSEPTCVSETGTCPSLFLDYSGKYWLIWHDAEKDKFGKVISPSELYYSTSGDGDNWSKPEKVSVSSRAKDRHPVMRQDAKGIYWLAWVSDRDPNALGGIWIASSSDGIKWGAPRKIKGIKEGKEGDAIFWRGDFDLMIDARNWLWITFNGYVTSSQDGTEWSGPIKIDKEWPEDPAEKGIPHLFNNPSLMQDSNGIYWLAWGEFRKETGGGGICIYLSHSLDGKKWAPEKYIGRGDFPSVIQDWRGRYCISCLTDQQRFLFLSANGEDWSSPIQLTSYHYASQDGAGCSFIGTGANLYLLAWAKGGIWVSKTGDLEMPQAFEEEKYWQVVPELYSIGKFVVDENNLWLYEEMGSEPTIVKYDKQSSEKIFIRFGKAGGPLDEPVTGGVRCLVNDGKFLWIGLAGGGLIKYEKAINIGQHYTEDDGLNSNIVWGMALDGRYLWIATIRGLCRFDKITERFEDYSSLLSGWIKTLAIDEDYVWAFIDEPTRRLVKYSKSTNTCEEVACEEISNGSRYIWAILPLGDYIWIAAAGRANGLYAYDKKKDEWISTPLMKSNIISLGYDGRYLWAGTGTGLFKYDVASEKSERFVLHTPEETSDGYSEDIRTIGIDGETMWVGTFGNFFKVNLFKLQQK